MSTSWNDLADRIHAINVSKGFWPEDVYERNVGEALALIHSELTEAYEAGFDPGLADDKLTEYPAVWVEVADAVIRVLDLGSAHGVDFDVESGATPDVYTSLRSDLMEAHAWASRVLEAHRKMTVVEGTTLLYKQNLNDLFYFLLGVMEKWSMNLFVIEEKIAFNQTRPFKHGKGY